MPLVGNWKAAIQLVVALATIETWNMVLTETQKEVIWLRDMASDLGLVQGVTPVDYDSNNCQSIRTKHVEGRYNFIQEIKVVPINQIDIVDKLNAC